MQFKRIGLFFVASFFAVMTSTSVSAAIVTVYRGDLSFTYDDLTLYGAAAVWLFGPALVGLSGLRRKA